MIYINLLPWRETKRKSQQRIVISFVVLTVFVSLVMLASFGLFIKHYGKIQTKNLNLTNTKVSVCRKSMAHLKKGLSAQKQYQQQAITLKSLEHKRLYVVKIFKLLGRLTPATIALTHLNVKFPLVVLGGQTRCYSCIRDYLDVLQEQQGLSMAQLSEVASKDVKRDGLSDFSLSFEYARKG